MFSLPYTNFQSSSSLSLSLSPSLSLSLPSLSLSLIFYWDTGINYLALLFNSPIFIRYIQDCKGQRAPWHSKMSCTYKFLTYKLLTYKFFFKYGMHQQVLVLWIWSHFTRVSTWTCWKHCKNSLSLSHKFWQLLPSVSSAK